MAYQKDGHRTYSETEAFGYKNATSGYKNKDFDYRIHKIIITINPEYKQNGYPPYFKGGQPSILNINVFPNIKKRG